MGGEMAEQFIHVKHCTTHPKFLHSNSTSHRWVFGAIAELIDNAIDPDVSASQFCIDMKEFNGEPCLVFMDNGCGLTPERLHKMLSFGHSKKQLTPGDRSIGKHGNGFKSGTMRLGKDVLVLTKCATSMTAGFLSQTFLLDTGAEDILIPQVSWDLSGNRLCDSELDADESLAAICEYSIFPDEESLLAQLEAIPQTGAILIISNLRRHEGHLELDFKTDPHDIRITSELSSNNFQQLRPNQPNSVDVATDYSLRAYVAILYKVPRMQIFIRDKKVKTKRISGLLSMKETETYKPVGVTETLKIELGFNTENKNLYGMMLYHRNRLIKPYMRVGIQLEENERGMGVIGIVEANFLQPTHNKQDFDDTIAYRRLLKKLSDVLAEYWWEKKERNTTALVQVEPRLKRPGQGPSSEDVPDVVWVQCDNPTCLKWRVLPNCADPASLPDIWYCDYHPDPKYRRHEEPEQEWDASIPHEIVERRKERKREYDREKKEREAQRKRQRLEAVSREEQVSMQKQREAMQRELEDKLAREKLAQEQERRRQEEEVKKLNEECRAMKAKQQEMLEKQIELQRQLQLANEEKARQEELARQNQLREEQEELARQERERQEYEAQQEEIAREKRQQEEIARQQRLKAQQDERARQEKERQEYEAGQEELARQERERERKEIEAQKEETARLQRVYEAQQQDLQRQRQREYEEQQEEAVRQARVRQEYDTQHQRELVRQERQRQEYEAQQEELARQVYTRRQEDYERSDRLRQEYEAHMAAKDQSQHRNGIEGHNSEDHLTLGLVTQYGMPEGLDGINDLQDSSLQAEDLLRKGSHRQKNIHDQQLLVQNQGLDEPRRGQSNAIQQHHYMLPETIQGAQELQLIDSNSLSETLMTRSSGHQQTNKGSTQMAAHRSFGSQITSTSQGSQQSHGDLLKQMAANGISMSVQRYEGAERQAATPRGLHPTTPALMPPTPSPTHMPSFSSVNSSVPGQVQNTVRTTSSAAPLSQHLRQSLASKQGTSQAVPPFQEMSMQPMAANDPIYESRVQTMFNERVEAETQPTAQFSSLSSVSRGDVDDQSNGAGYYGRPGDAQPSGMLSVHLPLDSSGLSNTSSTTDGSLDQVVFVLQRRLRTALNTLEKIGGALEPNLLEMNSLPSTDLEVLSICEKAKNLVEMRLQAYREEITRLKAQSSYYTQGSLQVRQLFRAAWRNQEAITSDRADKQAYRVMVGNIHVTNRDSSWPIATHSDPVVQDIGACAIQSHRLKASSGAAIGLVEHRPCPVHRTQAPFLHR